MLALRYERFGGPVEVVDVPEPSPPDGGVVVRVMASGLCRSDWHAWAGHDSDVVLPHVPGHELAGVVEAVGDGVRTARVGDRVTSPFVHGCGACDWCRSGQAQVCPHQTQPGFTHWGSHAELVVVRAADTNLVQLPDDLSFDAAASLGCRFATAYRAVVDRARTKPGEWVVVVGAGGVGLSAIMVAASVGARVVAVDSSPSALEAAAATGAEHVLLAAPDVPLQVAGLTDGGAHVSIDAVGSEQTAATAITSLRRRGRHVQVGLLTGATTAVPLARVLAWELDVLGSHGMAASDYPAMLDLVTAGRLRPQDLVTRVVGFEEAAVLIPAAESASVAGMTVLRPVSER